MRLRRTLSGTAEGLQNALGGRGRQCVVGEGVAILVGLVEGLCELVERFVLPIVDSGVDDLTDGDRLRHLPEAVPLSQSQRGGSACPSG